MANGYALLFRLEMKVARTGADGFSEKVIDQADDGCATIGRHVTNGDGIVGEAEMLYFDRWCRAVGLRRRLRVYGIEVARNLLARRNLPAHTMARRKRHGPFRVEIEGIGGWEKESSILHRNGPDVNARRPPRRPAGAGPVGGALQNSAPRMGS